MDHYGTTLIKPDGVADNMEIYHQVSLSAKD